MIERTCTAPGCLCHPALCEGARCPDYRSGSEEKVFIPYVHTYVHAKRGRYGERASTFHQSRTQETGEKERCNGADLGRVRSQGGRNRRERITKNCLSIAYDDQQAGLVRQ